MRSFVSFIFLMVSSSSLFALVTISPVDIGSKPGFSTKTALSLETKRGNSEKDNYKGSWRTTYDSNTSFVTWLEFSGEYGKSNDQRDTNKLFSHLRHIHATPLENLNVEFFGQIQDNEFKLIKNRTLAGAGLRYKFSSIFDRDRAYIGVGGMYERIRYSSQDPLENNARISTYFTYTLDFSEKSQFSYMLYYQPLAEDFRDYVKSHELELKLHVIKKFFLQFTLSYEVDSTPATDVKRYDFTQNTSFVFEF
ncbi:MAG: DUF481 domain-containing protein [Sulfurimonadaceae bacterium]|jgi:hypothetical protein|nr:DUF481 domain-containing protein [Sulfurimonadaceae bacterium]